MKAGIDLGTTNSLIARLNPDGSPSILPDINFKEFDFTPSSVYLNNSLALVGIAAETKLNQDPNAIITRFFKRSFGSKNVLFKDGDNDWYAEGFAALMLKKLAYDCSVTGEKLEDIVITIPAHFDSNQRNAVIHAANMSNLSLLGLLEEPHAAALHYGIELEDQKETALFVYDLGGGTFDASVISLTSTLFQVLAKGGHTKIGGKEFDEAIMDKIKSAIPADAVEWNAFNLLHLRRISEKIKKELSQPTSFFLQKQIVIGNWSGKLLFERKSFEESIKDKISATIQISKECILEAGLLVDDIDAFLLVGGSSQIPLIKKMLMEELNISDEKIKLYQPLHAIAYGAALRCSQITGDLLNKKLPPEFKGVTGYNIGLKTFNSQQNKIEIDTLIPRNYALPKKASRVYYTRDDKQDMITLELVQYLKNPSEATHLGIIQIGPIQYPKANYMVEVFVENTLNGTIEITAYDPQTGEEIKQSFTNHPEESLIMLKQKSLVESTIINNIV